MWIARVLVPSPSVNRPSVRWSRSSAATAVSNGGRARASAIPVPMRNVDVDAATAAAGTHGLEPSWMENTPSNPAASASVAACTVRAAERDGGSIAQNLCVAMLSPGAGRGRRR